MNPFFTRFRQSILEEIQLPNYTGRHLFTTKLRLIIFLCCWVLVLSFFPFVWKAAPYTPLIFNVAFLVTAVCYNNVLHGRALFGSLVLESMSDFISQTTIIYLLGGKTNHFFLIYVLYCVTVGMFYGPKLATIASFLAIVCYGALLFLLHFNYIPAIDYHGADAFIQSQFLPFFYLALMALFLAIVIYGIKIANYFSMIKENALAERNKQLLALHKISSTIYNVSYLDPVIEQVLQGVIQGLGYDICLLALVSRTEEHLDFHAPRSHFLTQEVSDHIGIPLDRFSLPKEAAQLNAIYHAIEAKEIVFRNEFTELTAGLLPPIPDRTSRMLQERMQWKKFIIIPLVSEIKVIGALIGISRIAYVEPDSVGILEQFASQAALAIESAYLFDELRKKNKELQEANRVKSEFLALMSHELRTPLHAILGFSELLADGSMGQITNEQRHMLKEIHGNARNLSELINNVLDLAKAEAGKMKLLISEFDFKATAEQVAYTLSPLVQEKKQVFSLQCREDETYGMRADEGKLRQILTNLLSNAIKFTPEEGKITLSFRRSLAASNDSDVLSSPYQGPVLYVEITDTGIGISPENQRELFQPFKQVDPSFTRRYRGTGLGLALCKEFVELHGGKIGVTSEEGNGSCFYFMVPMVQEGA